MQRVSSCTCLKGRWAESTPISRPPLFPYGSAPRLFGKGVALHVCRALGPC